MIGQMTRKSWLGVNKAETVHESLSAVTIVECLVDGVVVDAFPKQSGSNA